MRPDPVCGELVEGMLPAQLVKKRVIPSASEEPRIPGAPAC